MVRIAAQLASVRALVCAACWASFSAYAALLVPDVYATAEGNALNGWPFNTFNLNATQMRYQQVYDSSQFATLSGPSVITQLAFRPDAASGNPFVGILPNIQIDLSTTLARPDALSGTFANNVGSDDLIVYSGALSLSSSDAPGPGGSRAFDIIINLTTPFLYDPTSGNLLVDVRNFSGGATTQFDAVSVNGDSVSRVYGFNANGLTGTPDPLGLVTQFTFASPVPEPTTLALVCIAIAGLRFSRRH